MADQRIYRTFEEFEREELRRDGYFESVEKPWDWMAGALLVREAGGRVTELKPKDAAFPRIIASGPAIHDGLVTLLAGATEGL